MIPRPMARTSAVLALLLLASPSAAGDFAVAIDGGYFDLTNARKSAKALFGNAAGGFTLGGSVRLGLGDSFFVAGGARYFTREGERVFVPPDKSGVFRLGHPLTLRIVPVYALAGYRFSKKKLVPYLGLGAGITSHREKSVVGGLQEKDSQTKASGHAFGGIEYGQGRFRFGGELMYSIVPKSIGLGGVSKVYDESDIGGLTVVGRLVYARSRPPRRVN